jgi:hypothetical protein
MLQHGCNALLIIDRATLRQRRTPQQIHKLHGRYRPKCLVMDAHLRPKTIRRRAFAFVLGHEALTLTSFVRPAAPDLMKTALFLHRKCAAIKAMSSSFARPSTGGDFNCANHVPSASCARDEVLAHGFTLTSSISANFHLPSRKAWSSTVYPARRRSGMVLPPRAVDGGNVDLAHRHHCCEGTTRFIAACGERLG